MILTKIIKINGSIKLLSGLHIGGSSDEIKIGGIDTPVIKNPVTNEPYIPGSSLKGKIRSLLELHLGGSPHKTSNINIGKIFGVGAKNNNTDESDSTKIYSVDETGPTRVSFYDCNLNKENKELLVSRNALTEDKIEVSIDRTKGTAISPRHIERVPAGAIFDFYLSYKISDDIDEKNFELLLIGMKLLEMDSLGGSGSRGYGRVEFELSDEHKEKYEKTNVENIINFK